jgi:hypothetical protein
LDGVLVVPGGCPVSTQTILICVVVPFLVLVLVFGVVVIVALCHARPEDIPTVLKESAVVFVRIVERAPRISTRTETPQHDSTPGTDTDQTPIVEEIA